MSGAAERPREAPLQERFHGRFLVFHGRIGRLEYLLAAVLLPIAGLVAAGIVGLVLGLLLGLIAGETAAALFGWIPLVGWFVLSIWITLAAGIRRCHDLGLSGWLLLLSIVPLVGAVLAIALLVWPGEKGDNKYGPQP